MRIVMVAHSNAPWTPHYARYFMSKGHECHLVSFSPDAIEQVGMSFFGREPFQDDRNKHLFVTKAPIIAGFLRRTRPDVLYAPYLVSNGLTAALAWSGPLVTSAVGSDVLVQHARGPALRWLHRLVIRLIARRSAFVHAVSQELVEALVECGVPPSRLRCFPMGVNLDRFRPMDRQRTTVRDVHIICTRRHDTVYENQVIVEAAARLHDQGRRFRLTFVGGGRLLEECRAHVSSRNLNDVVAFISHVNHGEMPRLLQSADIYVSASASDGTSSSLLEAQGCGLFPVVSRITANLPWVRDGETGYTFAVGDEVELAAALAQAIDRPDLRLSAIEPNRLLVSRWGNQEVNDQRLLGLLEEAVSGHRV